jgi:hypothetical protein
MSTAPLNPHRIAHGFTAAGVLAGTPTDVSFAIVVSTAVPTLPQLVLLLLAAGLAAGGYLRLRRRARAG